MCHFCHKIKKLTMNFCVLKISFVGMRLVVIYLGTQKTAYIDLEDGLTACF